MCTAFISQQERVTLAIITGIIRFLGHTYQPTIGVLTMSGGDTFTYNRTAGVLAQMNHFRSGISLLIVVRYSYGIEFSGRVIARQNTGRVFPSDGRTGFHLCPR